MKIKKIAAVVAAAVMALGMTTIAMAADVTFSGSDFPKTAGATYTVEGDVTEVTATVAYTTNVEFNDWCGDAIKVTDADGTVTIYGMGGAQVSWNASLEAQDAGDVPAVGGADYFALDAEGKGTFNIPVAGAGSVIEVFDLCWDSVPDATHFTIEFAEAGAATTEAPAEDAPAATVDKTADASTVGIIVVAILGCAAIAFATKKRFFA